MNAAAAAHLQTDDATVRRLGRLMVCCARRPRLEIIQRAAM